jgi:hypothetical protein
MKMINEKKKEKEKCSSTSAAKQFKATPNPIATRVVQPSYHHQKM